MVIWGDLCTSAGDQALEWLSYSSNILGDKTLMKQVITQSQPLLVTSKYGKIKVKLMLPQPELWLVIATLLIHFFSTHNVLYYSPHEMKCF